MKSLGLDPADYPGSYKLIGGRPSLDLVNTISWPDSDREHDWLATPANMVIWLDAVGLASAKMVESDIASFREVREVLSNMLQPLAHRSGPTRAAGERFNHLLTQALRRRRIDPVDLTWTWEPPQQAVDVLDPVILDAAELITTAQHDRLKHCPSCDWLFEDQTRNGRRRWCDMADCGSRAKARSYYHRHKN